MRCIRISHSCNFNLRREARPLATPTRSTMAYSQSLFQSQTRSQAPGDLPHWSGVQGCRVISISDEKPGPWRLFIFGLLSSILNISISDEKPGPWRLRLKYERSTSVALFQSQTRSQAPGDFPWQISPPRGDIV